MKGNNVTAQSPEGNGHLTYQEIAGYSTGALAAEQERRVQRHCVDCSHCLEELMLVMRSLQPDNSIDQQPEFAALLESGAQSARKVLRQYQMADAQPPLPEQPAQRPEPKNPAEPMGLLNWLIAWFAPPRRLAFLALAVAMLLVLPVWWLWQRNQPVERAMASLRKSWTVKRPVESRVTGDFPALPYERVRSAANPTALAPAPANQDQLQAAELALKLAVADHGTPKARHALARLHLLKLELDQAENQLQQVLEAEPDNAAAHADMAALYYERGATERSFPALVHAAQEGEKAIALAPNLPEAWFNLALIHEEMLLINEAQKDRERYLELDATSKWADEARARLQKLRQGYVLQEPQPDKVAAELRAAFAARDDASLRRMLEEHFAEVTDLIAGRFMDEYLAVALAGKSAEAVQHHQLLQRLATLIRDTKGDHYFADLLRFVDSSPPARLEKIRALRSQLQQGQTQYQAGQYEQAIQFAIAAKVAAESIADVCHTEAALYCLARIETPQTETKEMPIIRQRLLYEAERRRHRQMQARALLALTNQYGTARQLSLCLEASLQALEIASEMGDTDVKVAALRAVGVAYSYLGEHEQGGKAHYAAVQTLYAHPVSLVRACQTYVQFARSLADSSQYYAAQHYQREALQFCQRSNPTLYLSALGRAGKYAALAGQMDESLRLFQLALTEAEDSSQIPGAQNLQVDLYLSLGDALVRNQRFREAESAYERARETLGQEKHLRYLSAIEHGLATALLPQGKIQKAETALNKSVELAELSRGNVKAVAGRSTYVSSQLAVYQSMVDFQYFSKHSPERAFDFSEIYRSRELLDLIAHSRGARWNERQQDLKLGPSTEPLTLREVQAKCPANTQLVEYALTEKGLLIWVIDREGWNTESVQATPAQLQALISAYLQAVREQRELASVNTQAIEIYRLLIQPVARHLKHDKNLVIIPDGALSSLPFAALVNPDSKRYLVEEYVLTINPSASILGEMLARSQRNKPAPIRSLLAVSDPAFDQHLFPKLPRLPGAGEEIQQLLALYPVSAELSGAQATKEAFLRRAIGFDVLHMATHSVANHREPLLSAIVLAAEQQGQRSQRESLLPAHEIFRLRLPHTRLVILSSCSSLANQQSGHNGLGGLAHAFFSAGVPAVIGSLWEVNDESTAKLMAAFHHSWRSSTRSSGQALREAQLTFLHSAQERWRHPFYWAAFHVAGNGITV
jgi:CHAT domain-containing protein